MGTEKELLDKHRTPAQVFADRVSGGGLTREQKDILVQTQVSQRSVQDVLVRLCEADITGADMVRLWDESGVLVSYLMKRLNEHRHNAHWLEEDVHVLMDYFLIQEVILTGVASREEVYACSWENTLLLLDLIDAKEQTIKNDVDEWQARLRRLRRTIELLHKFSVRRLSVGGVWSSALQKNRQAERISNETRRAAEAGNFDAQVAEGARRGRPSHKPPPPNFGESGIAYRREDKKKT